MTQLKISTAAALAAVFLLPLAAVAQQKAGQPPAQQVEKKDWDIRLGAGAQYQPEYEGSDDSAGHGSIRQRGSQNPRIV